VYDEDGNRSNGVFAQIFEEEYEKIARQTKYQTLFKEIKDKDIHVSKIHDGYFSIDKKGKKSNTKDKYECFVDTSGTTAKDDSTFSLIMKDKEKLLSFNEPLRFIFSHSALKEGWDNPNVFQICTLVDSKDDMTKRQKVGRGLRLCVNQEGERIRGFEVNTLTVMANESYEEFAKALQKEIEEDTGYKFGMLYKHSFARIIIDNTNEKPVFLDEEKSEQLYRHFLTKGYIKEETDRKTKETVGIVEEKLKLDIKDNRVDIPEEFENIKGAVLKTLKRVAGNVMNIKNKNDARKVNLQKCVFLSPEFADLWNRIKYKTTYSVNFDSEEMVTNCAKRIFEEVVINKGKFITKKVRIQTSAGGVTADEETLKSEVRIIDEIVDDLPDIVTYLQNETNLTRKSLVDILLNSKRLEAFKRNPQAFIEAVLDIIRAEMRLCLVDGIKYRKLGDTDVWCQQLFENRELQGYLNSNLLNSAKSPYDYVIYDSTVERNMATYFEQSQNVKVYAKLPSWFVIDTPLGDYNPDWALVWEDNGKQSLYFVVETKGGLFEDALRITEQAKIDCGKKHFEAIDTGVSFAVADSFGSLENKILGERG
jgi:type III restriction enzyme